LSSIQVPKGQKDSPIAFLDPDFLVLDRLNEIGLPVHLVEQPAVSRDNYKWECQASDPSRQMDGNDPILITNISEVFLDDYFTILLPVSLINWKSLWPCTVLKFDKFDGVFVLAGGVYLFFLESCSLPIKRISNDQCSRASRHDSQISIGRKKNNRDILIAFFGILPDGCLDFLVKAHVDLALSRRVNQHLSIIEQLELSLLDGLNRPGRFAGSVTFLSINTLISRSGFFEAIQLSDHCPTDDDCGRFCIEQVLVEIWIVDKEIGFRKEMVV
jgi:hypothetical protein